MPDRPRMFDYGGYCVSVNPEPHRLGSTVAPKWLFHIYRKGESASVHWSASDSKEGAETAARKWIDEHGTERRRAGDDRGLHGDDRRRTGYDRRHAGNDRRINKLDRRAQRRDYPDDRRLGDRRRMPIG